MTHEMKCIYRVAKVIIVTSLVKPLVVMLSYIPIYKKPEPLIAFKTCAQVCVLRCFRKNKVSCNNY